MKKVFLSLMLCLCFFLAFASASSSNETMKVKVDVIKSTIGISVPSLIEYGNIAAGYLSDRKDIDIINLGNVDVRVTPELENYSENIFTNLVFKNVLDDPFTQIGDYYIDIERPTVVGETRTESVYMYLDLTSYEEEISQDMDNHEANVTFWAVSI
jgi:hypothetical protein